jgi:hypothetical protein
VMPATADTCSARLRPVGLRAGTGLLVGYPGASTPMVRSLRDGDSLRLEIRRDGRIIGGGVLVIDALADAPTWAGEVTIDACRWWASSARGSGVISFQNPRRPFEAPA